MTLILQSLLTILVSCVVWLALSLFISFFFSFQIGFGQLNADVSVMFKAGLIIGLAHGLVLSGFFAFYNHNTLFRSNLFSILSTEILLLLAMISGIIYYVKDMSLKDSSTVFDIFQAASVWIFSIVVWYLILSAIFLIPSVIIGFSTKKVLDILDSKILS